MVFTFIQSGAQHRTPNDHQLVRALPSGEEFSVFGGFEVGDFEAARGGKKIAGNSGDSGSAFPADEGVAGESEVDFVDGIDGEKVFHKGAPTFTEESSDSELVLCAGEEVLE